MKEETRMTSLALPVDLWRAVHIRALDEDANFRDIVQRALEMYLKQPKAKK